MKKLIVFALIIVGFAACQPNASEMDTESWPESFGLMTGAGGGVQDTTPPTQPKDAHGNKPIDCKGDSTKKHSPVNEIKVTDLPATVTAYVSSKYPGATIKHASKTPEGGFFVGVLTTANERKGLIFNANGTFQVEKQPKGKKRGR